MTGYKNIDEYRAILNTNKSYPIKAVYDLETTGFSEKVDRILQFSAKKYDQDFNELDSVDIYIKTPPDMKINGTPASMVNGITDEMLDELGIDEYEAFERMKDFFEGCELICGYNHKSFDNRFMREFYQNHGDVWNPTAEIDVYKLAQLVIPDTDPKIIKPRLDKNKNIVFDKKGNPVMKAYHNLETITNYFDVNAEIQFHSAIQDVHATAFCLKNLLRVMEKTVNEFYDVEEERIDIPRQKLKIDSFRIWNPSRSLRRVYFNTNQGSIYYDDVKKEWNAKNGNINSFDMADVWEQVKSLVQVQSETELFKAKENLGKNGEFFVFNHRNISKDDFDFDFDDKNLIMDYNDNGEMPSLWCQWVVTDNCQFLEWDGCEKFYSYTNWLCYLIDNFFAPYGYILNGTVDYQGEDEDDYGQITICDNTVYVY